MAPEDKASNLQPPTWSGEALKGPGSPTVSKHVLLAHQLQTEPKSDVSASEDCSASRDKTEGHSQDSDGSVTTPPPPPPLLSLQPPDAASLLPIPGLQPFREISTGGARRRANSEDSEDEDESSLSKKELRMRRNRESAARSRKRKRDEVEALSGRVSKLIEENTEQKKIIESLRQKLSDYRERFGSLEEGKA